MAYEIINNRFNQCLEDLSMEYDIYAPVRITGGGRFSDTDNIRYEKVEGLDDIEFEGKSLFSPKEILFPPSETLFHINGELLEEKIVERRKRLVFLRSCDIHSIKRLDKIFLENGGYEDSYYKNRREELKFVLIECASSFENCFCVSMGTNTTDDYAMSIRFLEDRVMLEVKDEGLKKFFKDENQAEFSPRFIRENNHRVSPPDVADMSLDFLNDGMWKDYDRCIGCGRCNYSCPTCTCFTMTDIYYDENKDKGERRRVWAGCQVDQFTDMAGGHSFRENQGSRMRFKTMHKIYDYQKRFGENMCVGCGRCDDRCPEYILFANCINRVSENISRREE